MDSQTDNAGSLTQVEKDDETSPAAPDTQALPIEQSVIPEGAVVLDLSDNFADGSVEILTGAIPAKVDPDKYAVCTCPDTTGGIAEARSRQWSTVPKNAVDRSGQPIVANQEVFQVNRQGLLTYMGDVLLVRPRVLHDEYRRRQAEEARRQRDGATADPAGVPGLSITDQGKQGSFTKTINLRPPTP